MAVDGDIWKWTAAVDQQVKRIFDPDADALSRERDAYFFAMALRQLLRAVEMAARFPTAKEAVKSALDTFDAAIPNAREARNILEHFDEYERGTGSLQRPKGHTSDRPLWDALSFYSRGVNDDGTSSYKLHLGGGYEVDVASGHAAAGVLANAVLDELHHDNAWRKEPEAAPKPEPFFDPSELQTAAYSWAIATRIQLDRWEPLVARYVSMGFKKEKQPGTLIWQARFEHHFLLIAAAHFVRSTKLAGKPDLVGKIRKQVVAGRDLHEHWFENMPIFNMKPRTQEPSHPSGQGFAERNPERSPYFPLAWDSHRGPMIQPDLPAAKVHAAVTAVMSWAESERSDLTRFVLPREPSPWVGEEAGKDHWWPRPVE